LSFTLKETAWMRFFFALKKLSAIPDASLDPTNLWESSR